MPPITSSIMTEANRSLSACLRCRRQKLKCGGPGRIPCRRCVASNAECVFIPPRAAPSRSVTSAAESKTDLLEQRLDAVEGQLRAEIQELRAIIAQSSSHSTCATGLEHGQNLSLQARQGTNPKQDVTRSLEDNNQPNVLVPACVTNDEWDELYAFFLENCSTIIAVIDDYLFSQTDVVKQHPLMSTVICGIAARAVKPARYHHYVAEADKLIMSTFQGPSPDLLSIYAMMMFSTWAGRPRLLGYIASLSNELKLNEAAIILGDEDAEHTEDLVGRGRCWFTLCCLDLTTNISRLFVVNRMRDYLPHANNLLTSPYRHPVDDRICAYIKGFTITGNVKGQLQTAQLRIKPLSEEVASILSSSDEEVDQWFHQINNNLHPLYQTYSEKQDRNRLMVPFAFMKLYINGLVMNEVHSADDLTWDPARIAYIQKALDSASLIIQTQFESVKFRKAFQYTMDYCGTPTYYAVSFILKGIPIAHKHVDCQKYLTQIRQAAQMFEQGGAMDAANELRHEGQKMATPTQTILSPEAFENPAVATNLFDIPSFFEEMTWDDDFPALTMFPTG